MADVRSLVDALMHTLRATAALADGFDDVDWDTPTECPGWTVRDAVSHLIGVELMMLGEPVPEHEVPAYDHLKHEVARTLEIAVDLRRTVPGKQVAAELHEVVDRRSAQLAELLAQGGDPVVSTTFFGERPLSRLLPVRVFDCWAHEQDVRRAVGRPGDLDSPAAAVTRDYLARTVPYVAEQAGLGDAALLVRVTGPMEFERTAGDGEPSVTVTTDWESYVRLSCGRVRPGDVPISTTGDPELVGRVLEAMAVTP